MTKAHPPSKLLQWIPVIEDFLDEAPTEPMVRESLDEVAANWRRALHDMATEKKS